MDQYDFENIISDADYEFTLEDILSEFGSDTGLYHPELQEEDTVTAVLSMDEDMSNRNNHSHDELKPEGAHIINNTNETYDTLNYDAALDTSYSGEESGESENADSTEYSGFYSRVSREDPDLNEILNEMKSNEIAQEDSSYYGDDYPAESEYSDIEPESDEYNTETTEASQFMSVSENWEIIKDAFQNTAEKLRGKFQFITARRAQGTEDDDTESVSESSEAPSADYYVTEDTEQDYYASLFEGSMSESTPKGNATEQLDQNTVSDPGIPVSSAEGTDYTDDSYPGENESFTPEISTVQDAQDAYASDISPDDGFSEEDPDEYTSALPYYWNRIKTFFTTLVASIVAFFQGKYTAPEDSDKKPSRFVQFLASLSLKMQQHRQNTKAAPAREAEELGPELSSDKASRYYGSQIKFMKRRLHIAAFLCVLVAYISFGLPVPGRLNNAVVAASACLALEISVVVCCLDIFTAGILDLIRKHPNANTLISLSCFLSALDAIIIAMGGKTEVGLPYCGISAITITCALWASLLYCRGNRITLRTLALSKDPHAITAETNIGGYPDITLLKTKTSTENFVRRTEEMALDDEVYTFLAPWLIGSSIILSLIATAVGKNWGNFFHIWSAIIIPAAPFCVLLSFPLPFLYTARNLFHNGTAIAGWSGLCDIGESKHIVVTDHDIFPKNTISIDSIRILEGVDPQKIITYTGSVIIASGSALSPAFSELMNKNSCVIEQVYDFKCHEGGGLTAMISGDEVLCGNSGFMHLMGIHIPQKLATKSSVFIAVNGIISAIYTIKYTPVISVQKALITLLRSKRTSIFAVKDFNITPEMIRHKFKMPSDRFDFPSFADRYAIAGAKRGKDSKIAAIVSRNGLPAMVQLQDEGHRLYSTIRLSVLLSVLCSIIGMILVFLLCLSTALDSISASNLLLYMMIWLIIQFIVVALQNR